MKSLNFLSAMLIVSSFVAHAANDDYSPICTSHGEYQKEGGFIAKEVSIKGKHEFKLAQGTAVCGGTFYDGSLTLSDNAVVEGGYFEGKNSIGGDLTIKGVAYLYGEVNLSGKGVLNHGQFKNVTKIFDGLISSHPSYFASSLTPPVPDRYVKVPQPMDNPARPAKANP